MNPIEVTQKLSVSAQLQLEDFVSLKAQGFTTVINNRPDGEDPAQPASAAEEDAAWVAGLTYVHIPVTSRNMPDEAVRRFKDAIDHAPGPVLAHCRSGARSFYLWVLSGALEKQGSPASRCRVTAAPSSTLPQNRARHRRAAQTPCPHRSMRRA